MKKNILQLIYLQKEIFIIDYTFDDENRAIDVICEVPLASSYGIKPVTYVTTENYVRCLSQACYLLTERVLNKKLISIDISVHDFLQAAINYELYYRNLAMTFHVRVPKDERFKMRFSLKNFKQIKRIQDFFLFTFTNEKTVISGEMSFVVIK